MWRNISKVIDLHQHFVITTHIHPDGDGIGSASALIELLHMKNKSVRFICDSPIPKKFGFLDVHGLHQEWSEKGDYSNTEVLIVLDTHVKERIGRLAEIANQKHVISICIDHHTLTQSFTPYTFIKPKACCVGEMVYTLFKECGLHLNLLAATGIYTSVICDTGRFSYSSTSREAHKVADECINIGVDPDLMYSRLYQHVTLNQFKVFANSLQKIELHLENKVVIHPISMEDWESTGANVDEIENIDMEYILELNKQIEEVECVVLLRELRHNQIRVSIRSKSNLDISTIMRSFGGGGHKKAAGASFRGSMEKAKEEILKILEKMMTAKI